jgi:hypothetical protein
MRSDAPTKGDMGCVWPKGTQVANGDDKKQRLIRKGVCTKNTCGKDVQNTETGAPVWNECPRGGRNVWEN